MGETRNENEWNDPPGVASELDDSRTEAKADANTRATRGPFAGLRRMVWWLFWGGLVLAVAFGALGWTTAEAVPLVVGYLVTIGFWLSVAWGVLWFIDVILAYLKE